MKKQVSFSILLAFMVLPIASLSAQDRAKAEDFSGAWAYEVKDTPYGDFFGVITLTKEGEEYQGTIHNAEGTEFEFEILRFRGNRMTFSSNIEEAESVFSGFFEGDTFQANGEVTGDDFTYKMVAKRQDSSKPE